MAECYLRLAEWFDQAGRNFDLKRDQLSDGALFGPPTEAFTPKMASALFELRVDFELEAYIGNLRRKANDGTLTPVEDADYRDFVETVDLISIMQAKARRFLAKQCA